MGEYVRDEWDGFDTANHVYDDKKEKSFQSRIWVCIAIIMGLVLLFVTSNLITEIKVLTQGTEIVAQFDDKWSIAKYIDENGNSYSYDLSSYYPKHEGTVVSLYYIDDIYKAIPQNTLSSWLVNYTLFGAIFGLCVWRIVKIYKN